MGKKIKVTEAAKQARRENGKKGGRPPGAIGLKKKTEQSFMQYVADIILKFKKPIIMKLVAKAKEGDVQAARELFDRGFGKAMTPMEEDLTRVKYANQLLELDRNIKAIIERDSGHEKPVRPALQK
jgi:hypothetical protein